MITVNQIGSSFSVALKHISLFRTQPIHFAFRAPTGKQIPFRRRKSSPYYTLLFGQRGTFHVYEKDCEFLLLSHSLLLLAPNRAFEITTEEHANAAFLAVEFEVHPKDFILDLTENGSLYLKNAKSFEIFFDELHSHSADSYGYCEALLLTLFQKLRHESTEKDDSENLYRHALSYIRRHVADPPTSSLIAFGTHYSADHLSKLLKSSYGLSLSELIKRERLELLRSYLRFTSYTPNRIASILAFPSVACMTAFFKYHTNMTPTEYKKSLQKTFHKSGEENNERKNTF